MSLEGLVELKHALLPEGPIGCNASARTNHDDWSAGVLRQVEGVCLSNHAGDFGAHFNAVQPSGAHTIVPGTCAL